MKDEVKINFNLERNSSNYIMVCELDVHEFIDALQFSTNLLCNARHELGGPNLVYKTRCKCNSDTLAADTNLMRRQSYNFSLWCSSLHSSLQSSDHQNNKTGYWLSMRSWQVWLRAFFWPGWLYLHIINKSRQKIGLVLCSFSLYTTHWDWLTWLLLPLLSRLHWECQLMYISGVRCDFVNETFQHL